VHVLRKAWLHWFLSWAIDVNDQLNMKAPPVKIVLEAGLNPQPDWILGKREKPLLCPRLSTMYNSLYRPGYNGTSLITVLQTNIFKCKLQISMDTTPCRLLNILRPLGWSYVIHFQVLRSQFLSSWTNQLLRKEVWSTFITLVTFYQSTGSTCGKTWILITMAVQISIISCFKEIVILTRA